MTSNLPILLCVLLMAPVAPRFGQEAAAGRRAMTQPQSDRRPAGREIVVRPSEDLQAAIDAAPEGATVALTAGATYTGNFVLRRAVTLTTGAATLGARRASPDDRRILGSLVSPDVRPALEIAPGARHVTVARVHVQGPSNDILMCGRADAAQTTRGQQPRGVVLDQLVIEGDPGAGAKRGVALNCADARLTRSTVRGIWKLGQDSAAVGGWNGEGPFLIDDNLLEAASIGVLFGGADPAIPGLIPSDITLTNNVITKDPAWRGRSVSVKNLLELKIGRRVTVRNNVLEHNWLHAQTGWAIVITPSQYGTNPDAIIEDVLIEDNVIRRTGSGINILGYSQHQAARPTRPTRRVTVRNNWFQLDRAEWGGQGWFLQLGLAPRDIAIERNTIEQNGTQFISASGAPSAGFRFVGNLVKSAGRYGVFTPGADGRTHAHGARWREYFPGGLIEKNALAEFSRPANLPGNLHVSAAQAEIAGGYGAGAVAGYGRERAE